MIKRIRLVYEKDLLYYLNENKRRFREKFREIQSMMDDGSETDNEKMHLSLLNLYALESKIQDFKAIIRSIDQIEVEVKD